MDDPQVGKSVRDAIHVQGDGRPFSTAVLNPQAVVRPGMIQALVAPCELKPEDKVVLVAQIAKAMRRYLGSAKTNERHAGHAGSRKTLDLIARTSKRLAEQLAALEYVFQNDLETHRFEDGDQAEQRPFELQLLVPQLERLGRSAKRAKAASASNRDGPPGHDLLIGTVADLLHAFEQADLEVRKVESGSAVNSPRRRVEGKGGILLLSIFEKFAPSVNTSAIWNAIDKVRSGGIEPSWLRDRVPPPNGPTISQKPDQ